MTGLNALERVLFAMFVVATNALVAINAGRGVLAMLWNSVAGIVPAVSLAALGSFLAFALFEDHARSRRYGTHGPHPVWRFLSSRFSSFGAPHDLVTVGDA